MDGFEGSGVILLDKPDSLTSMECVERVKEIIRADKAGHSGTLDPRVTGVLLIAINEATKAMPILIGLGKEYEGTMHTHGDVDKDRVREVVKDFTGRIIQTPPRRSAVARKPREREIRSFDIMEIHGKDIRFRVVCESGTYIRKLCHDFGERLGTGAHMTGLRRTRIDGFSLKDCINMEDVSTNKVIPLESILERTGLKRVMVKKESLERIRNGMPVMEDDIKNKDDLKTGDCVGIYDEKTIVALGIVRDPKMPVIKTDRVFK